MSAPLSRRQLMQAGLGIGPVVLAADMTGTAPMHTAADKENDRPEEAVLRVAVVQFRATADLAGNVRRHCEFIGACAKNGARVVVFPECSVTGFFEKSIVTASRAAIEQAEATIAAAARKADAYAIVGSPTKTGTSTYNSAVVITPEGRIIERYHKIHLAGEPWAVPGDHMSVFPIDGTRASIIICHDERYPELVRLPVLAGARMVFYLSHESDIRLEEKIEPYRAQIVARAVENSVYIAHANAPADAKDLSRGSHGQSRLISPAGAIMAEARIFDEEVISGAFDLAKASGSLANQSLSCPFLKRWWEEGAAKVKVIDTARPAE